MRGYMCLAWWQPKYENNVSLHPTKTDKWGIPQLLIDCKWTENDLLMMEGMRDVAVDILERIGAKDIHAQITDAPPGLAIHEMGTVRMGRDPETSVLNGNNQCHDVPNLYVTDGACMSSCGHVNPSLTYMAITARAANIAADRLWKRCSATARPYVLSEKFSSSVRCPSIALT